MRRVLIAIYAAAVLLSGKSAQADVAPAALFTDHCVLQRDRPLPVWGTASPGERITLKLADRTAETTADASGRWRVTLEPIGAGGPHELLIRGNNSLTIRDVLVGEVWVASGQSNMERKLHTCEGGGEAAAAAKDPQLRVFRVGGALKTQPTSELRGEWQVSSPENAKNWSAAGYFFAQRLRKEFHVPVGLLQNAVGWTPAEAWTSREALSADAGLKRDIVDRYDRWIAALPGAKAIHAQKLAEWNVATERAKAAGKPAPPEPPGPADASQFTHCSSVLFNGMLHPLMPYSIRGVIWYQGETNASRADQYRRLFPAMIRDWRRHWGQGDFPFLFVQIAPLTAGEIDRAELRDAQREALAEPNTAMVSTVDIGMEKDEHPQQKREVGERLALCALRLAYGRKVVASGPVYRSARRDGAALRVTFDFADGLYGQPRGAAKPLPAGASLPGFTIAGADQKFAPAGARIEGHGVIVSAECVPDPVAVRYAFANWPEYSLFNEAGLPASPFRTDDWPLTTAGATGLFYDQIKLDEKTLTPR